MLCSISIDLLPIVFDMLLIFSSIIQIPKQFSSLSRKSQHIISVIFNNILKFSDLLTNSIVISSTQQYTSLFNTIAEISITAVSIIEEYQEILDIDNIENENNLNDSIITFSKKTPYYALTNSNSGIKYKNRLNDGICIISTDPLYTYNNYNMKKIEIQINFHIHIVKLNLSNKKMSIGLHLNKASELQVDDMKLWIYNQNDIFVENDIISFYGMINDSGIIDDDYLICRNGIPININNNRWSTTLREKSNFNTQYKISEDKDDYKSIRVVISLNNIDDEVHFIKNPFANLNCKNNGIDLPQKDFNILENNKNIEFKLPAKLQPLASTILTMKSISPPVVNPNMLDCISSFTPLMKNEFLNLCQSMRCINVNYNDYLNKPIIIETTGAIGWTINVATSKLGEIIVKNLDKNDDEHTLHIDGKEQHISTNEKNIFDQDCNKIEIIPEDKINKMKKYFESKIGYDISKLYNDNERYPDISFENGQSVTILNVDVKTAKILQLGHGGWSGKIMKKLLGKQGIIESINKNGDVSVNISNIKRLWNPLMIDIYSPKTGTNENCQKLSHNLMVDTCVRIRRISIPELIAIQNHFCVDNFTQGENFVNKNSFNESKSVNTKKSNDSKNNNPVDNLFSWNKSGNTAFILNSLQEQTINPIAKFERFRLMLSLMGREGKIKSSSNLEKDGVCLVEFSFGLICRIPITMLILIHDPSKIKSNANVQNNSKYILIFKYFMNKLINYLIFIQLLHL